jgi:hypothetical protein
MSVDLKTMYVTRIKVTRDSLFINGQEFPWFITADKGIQVEAPNGADDKERYLVVRIPFFTDDCQVSWEPSESAPLPEVGVTK